MTQARRSKACSGSSTTSSLAVTTTYLRRLDGQEDHSWAKVAEGDQDLALGRDRPPVRNLEDCSDRKALQPTIESSGVVLPHCDHEKTPRSGP